MPALPTQTSPLHEQYKQFNFVRMRFCDGGFNPRPESRLLFGVHACETGVGEYLYRGCSAAVRCGATQLLKCCLSVLLVDAALVQTDVFVPLWGAGSCCDWLAPGTSRTELYGEASSSPGIAACRVLSNITKSIERELFVRCIRI